MMKKITLIALLFASFHSISQTEEGVFFDLNLGARFGGEKSEMVTMGSGFHLDGGVGYMFSNIIGIKGELGMDWFKTTNTSDAGQIDRSGMGRASLMAVLSISELADFGTDNFALRFNAGFGLASINNPSWKLDRTDNGVEFDDPFLKGNDDMIHFLVGLNPQYHINRNLSVNANITFIGLMKQDHTLDRFNYVDVEKGLTSISNATIGLSYRIGSGSSSSRMK